VEPDKVLAETTLAELKATGHEVSWARNAQTAVDEIDTSEPDVIVLEIQLGLHNGIELLYEIRSYPEWQHIPVVIYTLNRRVLEPLFQEVIRQLGVQVVYYKPDVTPRQLCGKITQLQLA
jgi:CheY-like chemotaxis protein